MKCANPECARWAEDLHEGTLRLVERAVDPADRVRGSDGGFPVCIVESRYFWLCKDCAHGYIIHSWFDDQPILQPRTLRLQTQGAAPLSEVTERRSVSHLRMEMPQRNVA